MTGHGSKFARKMEAAVGALLAHRNTEEAARAVGISSKTLLRWEKTPEFQAAKREAFREIRRQTIDRLQQAAPAAVAVIYKLMADPGTRASDRLRAAQRILDEARKARESQDPEVAVEPGNNEPSAGEGGRASPASVIETLQARRNRLAADRKCGDTPKGPSGEPQLHA